MTQLAIDVCIQVSGISSSVIVRIMFSLKNVYPCRTFDYLTDCKQRVLNKEKGIYKKRMKSLRDKCRQKLLEAIFEAGTFVSESFFKRKINVCCNRVILKR